MANGNLITIYYQRSDLAHRYIPPSLNCLAPKDTYLPLAGLSPASTGVVIGHNCNRKGENAMDQTQILLQLVEQEIQGSWVQISVGPLHFLPSCYTWIK
jgi:hypothetical protein